jgi:ATP-dependent Clp protease ATP-binding subunit ClpC
LRRLFKPLLVKEMSDEVARDVIRQVAAASGVEVDAHVLDRLHDLAELFLPGVAQPGRSVGLLRRVIDRHTDDGSPVLAREVLDALSQTSGIPTDFLDDDVPLDLEALRRFFEERVMGQPTAVSTVCDLLTLVKAGLNDPGKPLGVFLFVGPTGVGKTELAKALAAYLFGSEDRLLRFDMSEFASYDAYQRLLGTSQADGLLTGAVRQQPFSLVLLDEIEKSHTNVFDLCLQIFDAGRLTDHKGRTVNFKQTIVILTSNVGAADATVGRVGFNEDSNEAAEREALLSALRRFFRPEFLNRLDRVVHFRSLSAATTRKIAEKEVRRVAQRAGLRRRGLSIDVDPSALGLLVREGHSPTYGARPLKRTVERLLLQPLARAIAAGKAPGGSVLRVTPKDSRLVVTVVPPEQDAAAPPDPEQVRAVREAAEARIRRLTTDAAALEEATTAPRARKAALLAETHLPGFWNDRERAVLVLDEVHRLDQVLSQADTLARRVNDTERHAAERPRDEANPSWLSTRLDELEREVARVRFLAACKDARALGDAFLVLQGVQRQGDGHDAVQRLANMYRAAGERRGFEVDVLDDRPGDAAEVDAITLLLSGAGAAALFEHETGLHALVRGAGRHEVRDVVRVDVIPAFTGTPPLQAADIAEEVRKLTSKKGRLIEHPNLEMRLTHRPSNVAIQAWTRGPRDSARAGLVPYLAARVARPIPAPEALPVRRRYVLGPSPFVRDRRTGLTSGHLDRVLAGDLDSFLAVPK